MNHALSDGIVVDLETLRGPDEAGGWEHPERFGLAVGVTWDAGRGFREWFEGEAAALTEELSRFGRVVGFNVLRFDYGVLSAYVPNVRALLSGKTVDILADVYRALGFRVSLDDLARATLGRGKTGTGGQALRWWREGKRELVIEYCRSDVALTRDLYLHGVANGAIRYPRYEGTREVRVGWGAR